MEYYTLEESENVNIVTRPGMTNLYPLSEGKFIRAINIGESVFLDDISASPINYTIPVELDEPDVHIAIYNMFNMTLTTFKDISDVMTSTEHTAFLKYSLVNAYEWLHTLAKSKNMDLTLQVSFSEEHEIVKYRVLVGDITVATYIAFTTDKHSH